MTGLRKQQQRYINSSTKVQQCYADKQLYNETNNVNFLVTVRALREENNYSKITMFNDASVTISAVQSRQLEFSDQLLYVGTKLE
jgi:hypothetical protein